LHPHEYNNQGKPDAVLNRAAEAKRPAKRHRPGIAGNGAAGGEGEGDGRRKSLPDVDPIAHTMSSFCKMLSISESFGWKMLKDGRLNCIRIGRRTLIPHSELQRLTKAAA
jgi:excisionase family DNA binding protein